MTRPPLKILYIAGCSRTGSTIVGNLLGQAPGFVHVGELREVWDLGTDPRQLCGCASPFHECSFWNAVFGTFGGFDETLARRFLPLLRTPPPVRTRDLLLRSPDAVGRGVKARFADALDGLNQLYDAIGATADADVIVDGSKYPSYAFLLGLLPGVSLHVLHLVRDPRAVAYSWAKRTKRNPTAIGMDRMEAKGVLHTCRAWNERNLLTRRLWGHDPARYSLLRYEDFVRDPAGSLRPALRMVGHLDALLPLSTDAIANLKPCHTVGGNPDRFKTGTVSLRADTDWKTQLNPMMKHAVSLLSYPWLRTYGYRATL